jgi:hypothetical protein
MNADGGGKNEIYRGPTLTNSSSGKSENLSYPTSRSLFHYTTARGLIGILGSQSLFATHAAFLNDSSECRLLRAILTPRLIDEFKELAPKLVKANFMKEAETQVFLAEAFEEFATSVFNTVVKTIDKISPIYITSFCLHGANDSDHANGLLSQWRGYANGGFAIEFDEDGLDKIKKIEVNKYRYKGILTESVWYEDHEKNAGLAKFSGIMAAALRVQFKHQGKDASDVLGRTELHDFIKPFCETLPFLKPHGFREEREYRMVTLAYRRGSSSELELPLRDIQFRSDQNGSVVPYIAVFDQSKLKLPIKSILIGPHPNQDNQQTAVELLLDQHDIKAEVRRSKLSLRQ